MLSSMCLQSSVLGCDNKVLSGCGVPDWQHRGGFNWQAALLTAVHPVWYLYHVCCVCSPIFCYLL